MDITYAGFDLGYVSTEAVSAAGHFIHKIEFES